MIDNYFILNGFIFGFSCIFGCVYITTVQNHFCKDDIETLILENDYDIIDEILTGNKKNITIRK